jgi:oligopeptide transport system substrate-binding protein
MPGYDSLLTGIDGVATTSGDLAKAQAHWQAYLATLNGHSAPPVVFTYVGLPSSRQAMVATTIASQWSQALPGIKASAAPLPDVLLQYGDFPVQADDLPFLADYPDPQYFLSFPYSTGGGFNLWGSSVPSADALLAQADAMSDPAAQAARLKLYNQAEQQLVQQVATCPLFQYQTGYLLRTNIYGMRQNGMGIIPDNDWVTGYRTA